MVTSVMFFTACQKSDSACNSTAVKKAIIENDLSLMRAEITKLCNSIAVVRSSADPDGLRNSLNELVAKLNQSCGIEAESLCYFCIDTLPGQAEVKVTNGSTTRILDISYSNDMRLTFVNMHD